MGDELIEAMAEALGIAEGDLAPAAVHTIAIPPHLCPRVIAAGIPPRAGLS